MAASILQRRNVNVLGDGDGDAVVVLGHGFGTDQTAWRNQLPVLLPRHRVVLFDHLGCGKADLDDYSPRRYPSLERFAEDLLAIHEALGLRWTAYVGHSSGAMIGLLAGLARPGLFERLVMIGASPRYLDEPGYVGGFRRADLDALYQAMSADYLGWANGFAPVAMRNEDRPGLGAEFARSLGSMRPDVAQSVARAIFESDLRARLAEVEVPTAILQSRRDVAVPMEVGEYLARRLRRGRLVVLDAEGHLPHLSAPEQVNAAVLEALDDVG